MRERKKKLKLYQDPWAWFSVLSVLGCTTYAIFTAFGWPKERDWPAWIQAIGSVAAVFAAIWSANTQVRALETHRWRLRADDTRQLAELATEGHDLLWAKLTKWPKDANYYEEVERQKREMELGEKACVNNPGALARFMGVRELFLRGVTIVEKYEAMTDEMNTMGQRGNMMYGLERLLQRRMKPRVDRLNQLADDVEDAVGPH